MFNFKEIVNECINEVLCAGIEIGDIVEWKVNARARRRFGLCTHLGNGQYSIEISKFLIEQAPNRDAVKNTIIHEILHTCKNCMNHGKEWQRYASIVNNKYGYNIQRLGNWSELGLNTKEEIMAYRESTSNYKICCEKCGATWYRHRMCSIVANPSHYRCRCGGKIKSMSVNKNITILHA